MHKYSSALMARSLVTPLHIAWHLGLAQFTVLHVLNGRADELRIRAQTQRVREAAIELGYRANTAARDAQRALKHLISLGE